MRGGFMHYNAFLGDSAPNRESAKQKLKMPVLALYGAGRGGDTGVLPQTLTAVAENVQGEGVPDCGHFIAEERPDYLAARLLKFFSE
jgi:pimeloyl-ACP methyl ester carboxylesterase